MTNDDFLEQLFVIRRALTLLITGSGPHPVDPAQLETLVAQRDGVMWAINRLKVAVIAGSFQDSEAALSKLRDATTELQQLTSVADDLSKAIDIAKNVVAVASGLLGA